MELLHLYNALIRRKWLVIQSVIFFFLAAAAVTFMLPKQYQATTKLIVESSDATSSILSDLGLEEVALSLSTSSDDMQNKIALATMRPVLEDVVWYLQLRDSDGRLLEPEKLVVGSFLDDMMAEPNVAVNQAQGTDVLMVMATSNDPEKSRLMADTLAQVYIDHSKERARRDAREARAFVSEQLTHVKVDLDNALASVADALRSEEVIDLESEVKAAVTRVSDMMLALESSVASIESLRAQIREEERTQELEGVALVSPASMAENSQIRELRETLGRLRQAREAELLEKTEQHPDVLLIDRQILAAETELELALQEQHELSPTIASLRSKLVGEQEKARETRAAIDRLTKQFGEYPDKMRRLSQLELAAEASEKLLISLQEQSFQIAIAEALTLSDLQFAEWAKAPERHSKPKLLVNLAAGLFMGLLFGMGLVFVFEYLDDSIKTPDELRSAWDVPQLGIIPRFGRRDEVRLIVDLPAHDPVAEAYRTVRNSIAYATLDKPPRYVAVTSAIPGEGKSTVSLNLAISMARDGKKVVVIDADFRRPTQHRFWPQTNNHKGVTNVLLGELELADAIQELPVPNLRLLAAGPLPSDPGRLVESLKMRQLLMDVARSCDLVVMDTPPIMVVNDAVVLSRQVDQLLVVVEAGKAARKVLSDLQTRLNASGLQPLGVILNKLDISGSYGGYYRYYRDHYSPHLGEERAGKKKRRAFAGSAGHGNGGAA